MRIRVALTLALAMLTSLVATGALALPAVQFGFVAIARGETLRINVVNTLPLGADQAACEVQVTFFDAVGMPFGTRSGDRTSLAPGHGAWIDLPASMAFDRDSRMLRVPVRASVEAQPGPPNLPPNPCVRLATTEEIFDAITGRTAVFQQNPGPPEVFGLVGVAPLQALSLTAVNLTALDPTVPPNPCRVTLAFADASGATFTDRSGRPISRTADLLPGAVVSLALPASLAAGDARTTTRVPARAIVESNPGPPNEPDACAGLTNTLEVVDLLTARTSLVIAAGSQPGPPTIGR